MSLRMLLLSLKYFKFGNFIWGIVYIELEEKLISSTSGKLQNCKLETSLMELNLKSSDFIDSIEILGNLIRLKS
jgi:hypothetical protein